jgi:hypothetical protein
MNVNAVPPYDPQYIEALGLAVHNFAWLEYNVVWIIEQLEPNYWGVTYRTKRAQVRWPTTSIEL